MQVDPWSRLIPVELVRDNTTLGDEGVDSLIRPPRQGVRREHGCAAHEARSLVYPRWNDTHDNLGASARRSRAIPGGCDDDSRQPSSSPLRFFSLATREVWARLIRMKSIFLAIALIFTSSAALAQELEAPAYVFIQSVSINDRASFERYQALARESIIKHHGEFLARGADVEYLEGRGDLSRLGLIRFPNLAAAKKWFASPEFQDALKLRRKAGEQRVFIIEGRKSD